MHPANCLNCDQPLNETQKFCSSCGQKTSASRLKMKDVLHDGFHYFTHADKGVIQLLKALIIKPGIVAREFIAGKRRHYFPPLNFFLVVAGLFLFITTSFKRYEQINAASMPTQEQTGNLSAKGQKIARYIVERKSKALAYITKYSNFVAMLAAPLITLVVWLCYKRAGYNYTEHLTANLYLIGFTNLFYCVVLVPVAFFAGISLGNRGIILFFALFEIAYRAMFYYQLFDKPTTGAAVKSTLISVIAVASWFIIIFIGMTAYIIAGM